MKVQLENSDMAKIFEDVKNDDVGAYLAACKAEKECLKLPWKAPGVFTEAILNAISDYYKEKEK